MKKCICSALLSLFVLSGLAMAQTQPPIPEPAKPAGVPGALTDEGLLELIKGLGYEPKITKGKNQTWYVVSFEQDGWTLHYTITLSPSKQFMWIYAAVTTLPENEKVPAEGLLRVLEENNNIAPCHFYYHKKSRQLKLGLALYNRNIDARVLRTFMAEFTKNLKNTQKTWDYQNWPEFKVANQPVEEKKQP